MRSRTEHIPRVLTIAGSDSGGGAGIQADLKSFTALGVYGASVVTALTAQNTVGVQDIHVPPTAFTEQQLESVLTDIGFDVVKTGMLPDAETIKCVAAAIRKHNVKTVIVDPVLVATSGDSLVSGESSTAVLVKELFPLATVVTPNVPEASLLTGRTICCMSDMRQACLDLARMGCKNVLLKGGHMAPEGPATTDLAREDADNPGIAADILYDGQEFQAFTKPRLDTLNTHGTGCTLASAIAAEMAKGQVLPDAVEAAKAYVYHGMLEAFDIGKGHGPLNHMNSFSRDSTSVSAKARKRDFLVHRE